MGSSKRRSGVPTENTPAPNHYSPGVKLTGQRTPEYTISREKLPQCIAQRNGTPGPGKYERVGVFDENKRLKRGFSCQGKWADVPERDTERSPGPAQYHSTMVTKSSEPKYKIMGSPRRTFLD
jgi:hypothetical protein